MEKKKSHLNLLVGIIVIAFAVVGVISLLSVAFSEVKTGIEQRTYKEYSSYEEFITPVVMNDPDTFDDITKADMSQLISIAIWSLLGSDISAEEYKYTDEGILVPAEEVESEFSCLFGSQVKASHMSVDGGEGVEFKYSENKKCYIIPITGITPIYTPTVLDSNERSDSVVLTVGYLSSSEWQQDSNGNMVAPEPGKIMKITLGKNSDDSFYVRAIQTAE